MASNPILVIFLHGSGASGLQLLPLSAGWQHALPTARFAAPDAPFHSSSGAGRKWFSVDGQELRPDRIHVIRRAFDDLIHDIVQREGFGENLDRVAFVGISQGAIVGLDAVASGRWPVGALVTVAGLLAPLPISAASRQTSVLLIHGEDDKTIPFVASTLAASRLKTAGFDVEANILPKVGHTISQEAAQIAVLFLKATFDA